MLSFVLSDAKLGNFFMNVIQESAFRWVLSSNDSLRADNKGF